jgi:hypothetical protein
MVNKVAQKGVPQQQAQAFLDHFGAADQNENWIHRYKDDSSFRNFLKM